MPCGAGIPFELDTQCRARQDPFCNWHLFTVPLEDARLGSARGGSSLSPAVSWTLLHGWRLDGRRREAWT